MVKITIREQPSGPGGTNAVVVVEDVGEYPARVISPFSPEDERTLAWYFEEHLRMPFLNRVRAAEAAASVRRYGEQLFEQLFRTDPDLYASYKALLNQGVDQLQIVVAGSPAFHRLHWEALKDPQLPRPFAVELTVVRQGLKPQPLRALPRPAPTVNILVVVARPRGRDDVGYRTISRPIFDSLHQAAVRATVSILPLGTYRALVQHLEATRQAHSAGHYHVIHFDLHGAVLDYPAIQQGAAANRYTYQSRYARPDFAPFNGERGFLFFEGERPGTSDPVEAGELAQLLITHQIPVVVLNACQSGKAPEAGTGQPNDDEAAALPTSSEDSLGAQLLQAGVQLVLAMGYSVTVSAAALLMTTLYAELLAGRQLAEAIRRARLELFNRKDRRAYFDQNLELEDWLLPVVYQQAPVRLSPREFTPEEARAFFERRQGLAPLPTPRYGFLGRDLDILLIERRVFATDEHGRRLGRPLLVRGMGGAGKTTLLRYLAAWWQNTQGIAEAFYFGFDQQAWTRQQIMRAIAEKVLSPVEFVGVFVPMGEEAQQAMLGERLRAAAHLLILDNLESVTGSPMAIPHTLPAEEQRKLRTFLAALVGGQTVVLLGSRGDETWLSEAEGAGAPVLREGGSYFLRGLDDEAATALAERILEEHKASARREDPDLPTLLDALGGFPLALEVTLPNLRTQTPAEVLSALRAGDATLDSSKEGRTESLLRCIDYSHSNLDPGDQDLLLCLAPFSGVISPPMLPKYIELLRSQSALVGLPFAHWEKMLAETQRWGLVASHPKYPGVLELQPALPYFLRTRLAEQVRTEQRRAIEDAFCGYYNHIGNTIVRFFKSKEPMERRIGPIFAKMEYANLVTALDLALARQVSIIDLYHALSLYIDATQQHEQGLRLGEVVLESLGQYLSENLTSSLVAEIVGVIDNIGTRQLSLGKLEAAEDSYQRALNLLQTNQPLSSSRISEGSASIVHNLGVIAQEKRQWAQAEAYYQQALTICREFGDRSSQAKTYHQLGRVAQEQRQWSQAEAYCQQALALKIEFDDRSSQAKTYHQLGIIAQAQWQGDVCEAYYQKALAIYVEFDDPYQQASIYHQLGTVAEDQCQWAKAETYYQQALVLKIEFDDRSSQASTYHQLGIVAQQQKQWAQALEYYTQVLAIDVEFGKHYEKAGTFYQLGTIAEELQQWVKAEKHYQEALAIFIEFGDLYEQGKTLYHLSTVVKEQEQWVQAETYYQQAIDILVEFNIFDEQVSDPNQLNTVTQEQRQLKQVPNQLLQKVIEKIVSPLAARGRSVLHSVITKLWISRK